MAHMMTMVKSMSIISIARVTVMVTMIHPVFDDYHAVSLLSTVIVLMTENYCHHDGVCPCEEKFGAWLQETSGPTNHTLKSGVAIHYTS